MSAAFRKAQREVRKRGGWDALVGFGVSFGSFKLRFAGDVVIPVSVARDGFSEFCTEALDKCHGEFKRVPGYVLYVRAFREDVAAVRVRPASFDVFALDIVWARPEFGVSSVDHFTMESAMREADEWAAYLDRPRRPLTAA